MKLFIATLLLALSLTFAFSASATGLATCDSGLEENWKSQEELKDILQEQGWEIRRIKIDGGCYEVYALDADGQRVEAYFHPLTLEPVETELHKD